MEIVLQKVRALKPVGISLAPWQQLCFVGGELGDSTADLSDTCVAE